MDTMKVSRGLYLASLRGERMNFDEGVADRLISRCNKAADVLLDQIGRRSSATQNAVAEFRGIYADCYRENADSERVARSGIVRALEAVASQAAVANVAARREKARLARADAWELATTATHGVNGALVLDVGPRPSMTETPRPLITVDTPWQPLRPWVGGHVTGTSSADPDELEAVASLYATQNGAAQAVLDQVTAAVGEFTGACSWVLTNLDDLTGSARRYLADNAEDTSRLSSIAVAFRTAGGAGHVGTVSLSNDTLTLATAPTSLPGDALLAFLATAPATDLKALAKLPGWQRTLQGMEPGKIATWWAGMNPQDGQKFSTHQQSLLALGAGLFGNLNGIPYSARDTANRAWLTQQLADANKQLDAARERMGSTFSPTPQMSADVITLQIRVKALHNIQRSLNEAKPEAPRFLVGLTADAPPLAQISIGNLDLATDVTYAVPGMNTSTQDVAGWVTPSQNLYNAQRSATQDPAGSTRFAVVAWIGYKTPPVPIIGGTADFGVIQGDYARAGAARLGHDLAGFVGTRPDADLNIVTHSYGTTTTADALAAHDYGVKTLTFLASAGIENSIPDAAALHADHVYAAQAPDFTNDRWAVTGRIGSGRENPVAPTFGATVFGADGEAGNPDLMPTTTHNASTPGGGHGYLDPRTESLRNTALATTGQAELLTEDQAQFPHPPPGPAPRPPEDPSR